MPFVAHLTTLDGEDFEPTHGWPTVAVAVGEDDDVRAGLGRLVYLAGGVWRYFADETEIGTWATVVIFSAPRCPSQFAVWHSSAETPKLPEGWGALDSIPKTDFLGLIAGLTPRKDHATFISGLLTYEKIPLTEPIRTGIARAFPTLK